jgi:hypothetical protein
MLTTRDLSLFVLKEVFPRMDDQFRSPGAVRRARDEHSSGAYTGLVLRFLGSQCG